MNIPENPKRERTILAGNPRSLSIFWASVIKLPGSIPKRMAMTIMPIKLRIAVAIKEATRKRIALNQPYLISGDC
jgi:hypothetical protein